jgi:predicted thioredoxin/glutaredoxin
VVSALPHVQIMSRPGCCLCDEAAARVAEAGRRLLCTWEQIDIDADAVLSRRYGLDIPVVLIDGEACFRHRVDAEALDAMLALKRREQGAAA